MDPLDNPHDHQFDNLLPNSEALRAIRNQVLFSSAVYFIFLMGATLFHLEVLMRFLDGEFERITFIIFLLGLIFFSRWICKRIFAIDPNRPKFFYVIATFGALFMAQIGHDMILQPMLIDSLQLSEQWFLLLIFALGMSLLGAAEAFIKIHKLRKESPVVPRLIFMALCASIFFILNYGIDLTS